MSEVKHDGGPAFPVIAENGLGHISDGMSLRDHFAACAMQALIARLVDDSFSRTEDAARACADGAYIFADAMLAERSK